MRRHKVEILKKDRAYCTETLVPSDNVARRETTLSQTAVRNTHMTSCRRTALIQLLGTPHHTATSPTLGYCELPKQNLSGARLRRLQQCSRDRERRK